MSQMIGIFIAALFMFGVSAIIGWLGGYGFAMCFGMEENACLILATTVGMLCACYAHYILSDKGAKFDDR